MAKLRLIERIKGLARVGLFTTCMFAGVGLLAARNARSEAGEASLVVGREFASLGGLVTQGYRVRLNGEELHVGSTTVDLPTNEVLDRFEGLCRQGSKGLEEAVQNPEFSLGPAFKADLASMGASGLGIVRTERMGEGTVACITHPQAGFRALTERLIAFGQSLDLKDLGKLRYVYTRPTSNRARSQVITVWTEGSLRLNQIFPVDGDAPGTDPVGMPRPPGSVRRLSAEVDGAPYGIRLYESSETAEAVLRFYDERMVAAGWEAIEQAAKVEPTLRTFTREGTDMMVIATPGKPGQRTSVSVVELPAGAPTGAQSVGQ